MSRNKPLTRDQLARFLPSHEAVRAFEQLFDQTQSTVLNDVTITGGTINDMTVVESGSFVNTSLTPGRVVYTGAGQVQTDSANLTFDGTTLTADGIQTDNLTLTSPLSIANGGTGSTATPTAGAVAYGTGSAYAFNSVGSAGQFLTSTGSGAPVWSNAQTPIGSPGYWGSFWDTTDQTAASTTVAYAITINSSDPENNGVTITAGSRLTFAHTGVYNIQFSAQFVNTDNQEHDVNVWFRKNGTDIADSNTWLGVPSSHGGSNGHVVAAWNYVISLDGGDYIELIWRTTNIAVSIQTIPAGVSPTTPQTPSVILTATQLTQIGLGYYGLTSTSSVAIGSGSKSFATNLSDTETAFTIGTRVRAAYATTPTEFMEGVITSFSGTALTVLVDVYSGAGTYANWTFSSIGSASDLIGGYPVVITSIADNNLLQFKTAGNHWANVPQTNITDGGNF